MDQFMYYFGSISNFLLALLALIIGWVIALIVSGIVKKALLKTELDNKLFAGPSGEKKGNYRSEIIISKFVFWFIMIFAFVVFLNMLNLTVIARPFSEMLTSLLSIIPDIILAIILFAVAWVIAVTLSFLIRKLGQRLPIAKILNKLGLQEEGQQSQKAVDTIANLVFYFVLLLFLPAILTTLNITGIAQPFQSMVSSILDFIPALFAAALVFVIGWFVAKVIRALLTNFLKSVGSERLVDKLGLNKFLEGTSLAQVIGTIVFVLIMIPVTISALEQLDIRGITTPAIGMLNDMMSMIPNIAIAIILVTAGIWIGRWVKQLVDQLLTRIGFNNLMKHLGLGKWSQDKQPYTLSQMVGIIAEIVIIILFVGEALQIVNLVFLVAIVGGIIAYLPHVLVAIVLLAIALFLAHLVEKMVLSVISGTGRVFLANIAKYSIIILAIFMALNQLGVADSIVNAAFILILGALALAFGLAFGLGGREFASKYLAKWDQKLEQTHVDKDQQ
ncbi:mechanosensitive ion channel [Amphibacillus sp. Q70]|uniref:mechanosensitive ion channel n=1 Tax=Amphibacillus sp. Q70 TaxID=3453416 RepID=UPI003F8662D8